MAGSIPSPEYDEYLTTYDVQQGGAVHFSACLIYDIKSREIVMRFVTRMNQINPYLIFFDPYFDILPGSYENDALAEIIEKRCDGKVLVFLPETDNFTNANMDFALQYAKHLDVAGKRRRLVPVHCHNNTFWPNVVKGLKEIDMYEDDSLQYWVQQSRQFRPSFSPKGPLRRECILFNRSYSYPLTGHQCFQTRSDGQNNESYSSLRTTYPPMGMKQAENGRFCKSIPTVEESRSLQIDKDKQSVKDASIKICSEEFHSRSISYQNDTSFGSSQIAFDESYLSVDSLATGENEVVVSDGEVKEKETTRNSKANQPHKKKDKRKTKFQRWLFFLKKKAE
ncbi:hypothetical protein CHS0354_019639 [Potamilus streckersoni]|uniref:Uncharacterized protein n=1 Tax=Potamilus streckersoni TaxID=2493646 RepID=A0AAE0T8V4_9BIVA|nr:hypothetical protein CHS0354_019639 [Potamilus streckersoni]